MTESGKLSNLLHQARAAFDSRNWLTAKDSLLEIIGEDVDYPGAQELLRETQKRQGAEVAYQDGIELFEKRNWTEAIAKLEVAVRDDPGHPDAPVKLKIARQWTEIERLEGKAVRHVQKSEWKHAVETLESLLDLHDPALDRDWSSIQQQLENARSELELMRTYQKCLSHMERQEWSDAQQCFTQLEEQKPGYRDVASKLSKITEELELEELYHQATGAEQDHKWNKALDLYGKILIRDRDYKDVVARMAHCNEQKLSVEARPEKRAERKNLSLLFWFLVGFLFTMAIVFFLAHPLRCLLEYQLTDVTGALIVALAGGVVAAVIALVPSERKNILWSINLGAASALIMCIVLAATSPPPPEDQCPLRVTVISTPALVSSTTSPTSSTSTPTDDYYAMSLTATADADKTATVAAVATAVADKTTTAVAIAMADVDRTTTAAAVATIEAGETVTAQADATTAARVTADAATATAQADTTIAARATATANAATVTAQADTTIAARATATANAATATAQVDETTDARMTATADAATAAAKVTTIPPPKPWNPQTPVPTAPPVYDPKNACVITPCAPAPMLDEFPKDNETFFVGDTMELKWEWKYCLPHNWKFAIRLSLAESPDSYQYIDDSKWISCKEGKSEGRYTIEIGSKANPPFSTIPGTYHWNIVVAKKSGEESGWERLSEVSETRKFIVRQREPPPTPSPTKPPPPTSTP